MVLSLRCKKNSPEYRLRSQQREQVWSHILDMQRAGLPEPGNTRGVVLAKQRDVFEDVILPGPVDLLGDGRGVAPIRVSRHSLPKHHQPFWGRVRKGRVQQGVKHAEDRAVGGDSQGERENNDYEETGVLQQTPRRIAYVRPERLERSKGSHSRYLLSRITHSREERYQAFAAPSMQS